MFTSTQSLFAQPLSTDVSSASVAAAPALETSDQSILWRRSSGSGENAFWDVNAQGEVTGARYTDSLVDQNWKHGGFGDFNSNGVEDIVWRNSETGELAIWYLNADGSVGEAGVLDFNPGAAWKLGGVGDFSADGKNDLFFYTEAGQTAVWHFNGTTRYSPVLTEFGTEFGGNWRVEGVADFNNDGFADVLWQQGDTQELAIWFMQGATSQGATVLADGVPANWEIVGTGDFNGDDRADVLWRESVTGKLASWNFDGTETATVISTTTIAETSPLDWTPTSSYAPATVNPEINDFPRQFLQVNIGSDLTGQIDPWTRNMLIDVVSRAEIALAGVVTPVTDVIEFKLDTQTIEQFEQAFDFSMN